MIAGYGHFGDGNIHLQVILDRKKNNIKLEDDIKNYIYKWVCDHKGSISAEHGVGIIKKKYLSLQKSETELKIA